MNLKHVKSAAILVSLLASPAFTQNDADFVKSLLSAKVVELNFVWDKNAPLLGFNPPFTLGLHTSHKATTGFIPGGIAFAADMMFFSGQHGAPTIDALGHISDNGKLYGGADAAASEGANGLAAQGIENYPREKFVNRGVLLDVARHKGVSALDPGYEITAADLEATAAAEKVEVRQGDSVLIRTGYGQFYNADRAKFMGPRPGPGEEAAKWLAAKRIFLTGSDQLTYEVFPEKGTIFPGHRILIADSGIYLVENLNLEELAEALARKGAPRVRSRSEPAPYQGRDRVPDNAFALLP